MLWEPLETGEGYAAHSDRTRARFVITVRRTMTGEVAGLRLTRVAETHPIHDPYSEAAEAARNLIDIPFGRGPGRPAGEHELNGLYDIARKFALQYENGESLPGYPEWQHEGEPPAIRIDPGDTRRALLDRLFGPDRVKHPLPLQLRAGEHQCDADGRCDACRTYGFCSKCGCPDQPHSRGPAVEDLLTLDPHALAEARARWCEEREPDEESYEITYRPQSPNAGRCPGPGGCFPGESCDYRDDCAPR